MNVRSPPNCSARSEPATVRQWRAWCGFRRECPCDSDLSPSTSRIERRSSRCTTWCSLPTFAAPLLTVVNPSPGKPRPKNALLLASGVVSLADGRVIAERTQGKYQITRLTSFGDTSTRLGKPRPVTFPNARRTVEFGGRVAELGADGYIVVANAAIAFTRRSAAFLPAACGYESRDEAATRLSMAARSCAAAKGAPCGRHGSLSPANIWWKWSVVLLLRASRSSVSNFGVAELRSPLVEAPSGARDGRRPGLSKPVLSLLPLCVQEIEDLRRVGEICAEVRTGSTIACTCVDAGRLRRLRHAPGGFEGIRRVLIAVDHQHPLFPLIQSKG